MLDQTHPDIDYILIGTRQSDGFKQACDDVGKTLGDLFEAAKCYNGDGWTYEVIRMEIDVYGGRHCIDVTNDMLDMIADEKAELEAENDTWLRDHADEETMLLRAAS